MSVNWALLSYSLLGNPNVITLVSSTSSPCHLFAHWTTDQPTMELLSRIIRGVSVPCYPSWHFVEYGCVEQSEPGETLDHHFTFNPWPYCQTGWVLLSTEIDLSIKASNSPFLMLHNNFPAPPPANNFVLYYRYRRLSLPATGGIIIKLGTFDWQGPIFTYADTDWHDYSVSMGSDSWETGLPWTVDDLTKLQIGPYLRNVACDYMWFKMSGPGWDYYKPSADGDLISIPNEEPPGTPHYQACYSADYATYVYEPLYTWFGDLYHFGP